jgi:Uma2 family endonuclease
MNVQLPVQMDKAEFLTWAQGREGRFELVGGRVVMMTGSSMRHAEIVGNVYELLRRRLDRKRWRVLGEFGLDVADRTIRYPDVMVLDRGLGKGSDLATNGPVLAVEVLSPSTMKADLGDKASEYLQLASLAAYVILAQDEAKAWVHVRSADPLSPAPMVVEGTDASILIPGLGIDLVLADVYADIEFD